MGRKKIDIETARQEFISRGYEPLFVEYENARQKLAYRCPKHPDEKLEISLDDLKHGKGCWKCGRKRSADKRRTSIEKARQDFIDHGYEPLFDEYKDNKQKLPYRCPKHPNEKLEISLDNLKHGHGCWRCGKESKMEQETSEYLTTHNFHFDAQYYLPGTKMRFDFMLLDNNSNPKTAIELNGQQHYEPVQFGGISLKRAKRNFVDQQKRDNYKRKWCQENSINLIEIPYDDFDLQKYLAKGA
jgi:hypothetical protein